MSQTKILKSILILYTLFSSAFLAGQNIWSNPSYKRKSLVFYSGFGTLYRHLEPNYFKGYDYYFKSPVIMFGFDRQFHETHSAYWGVGAHVSYSIGSKEYRGDRELYQRKWSSVFLGLKFFHHNKYFITKKIDVSSVYIIGSRLNLVHSQNGNSQNHNSEWNDVYPAAGIGLMMKYYMTHKISFYAEGVLGYKVDLVHFGFSFRLKN